MEQDLPRKLDRETLLQLPAEQLVEMIIEQAIATEELNKRILKLELEVQKLKVSRDLDGSITMGICRDEKQQELLWELGQIEIGVGTLVNKNQRIDRAVAQTVNSLKSWIKQTQPNIHADETPWGVKGVKEWLWIVAHRNTARVLVLSNTSVTEEQLSYVFNIRRVSEGDLQRAYAQITNCSYFYSH